MATGFAQSRNRKCIDDVRRGLSKRISRYSGSVIEIPELAAKLGVSGGNYMFLSFETRAQAEGDANVDTFTPI